MICAIVLAAGESKRMGQPKMLMPWGKTTVIGAVISTLQEAGVESIVVVTGGLHDKLVENGSATIRYIQNINFSDGEMLTSIQVGLHNIDLTQEAVLIALGDQPQMQAAVIKELIAQYKHTQQAIIVPSYKFHRGHPLLIDKSLWVEIEKLKSPDTLRDFLNNHADQIKYIEVDTPSVLQDIDTPQDYQQYQP